MVVPLLTGPPGPKAPRRPRRTATEFSVVDQDEQIVAKLGNERRRRFLVDQLEALGYQVQLTSAA